MERKKILSPDVEKMFTSSCAISHLQQLFGSFYFFQRLCYDLNAAERLEVVSIKNK